ncbi:MAG: cupin domain-containing protein [Verrucomicrobia bacterium]|nr:cupin domain-containing protein [Verrucomicrobiota bacterium]
MNDETTTLEERRAELAALHALGALDAGSIEQIAECLGCPAAELEDAVERFDILLAAMSQTLLPQIPPPPDAKAEIDRMLGFIQDDPGTEEVDNGQGFAYVLNDEGQWRPLPVLKGGARIKELSHDPDSAFTVMLLELDPGTKFPSHSHHGVEETYLISGDLRIEDRVLKPGDYARALPGSRHHALYSETGCRALVVTARENYPGRTIRAYGALHKALAQCKNLFAKESDPN